MPSYKYANDDGLSALAEGIFDKIHPKDVMSDEANLISVQTEFEQTAKNTHLTFAPQQDLHGYDHPWPQGGGKNLLPMTLDTLKSINTSGTWSGNVYTLFGVAFTVITDSSGNVEYINANGTATTTSLFWLGNVEATAGTYYFGSYVDSADTNIFSRMSGPGKDVYTYNFINRTAEPHAVNIDSNADLWGNIRVGKDSTANNLVFKPYFGKESLTTFEPYSNICPISGLDTAEVKRTGKNLVDWKINRTANALIVSLESGTYTMSSSEENTYGYWYIQFVDGDGNYIKDKTSVGLPTSWSYSTSSNFFYGGYNNRSFSFFVPANCSVVKIGAQTGNGTMPAQLEKGSTATTYEPYQESIVEAPLPETVYGGTLDLETGELVVDRAARHVSDFTWQAGNAGWWYTSSATDKAVGLANVFSDKYLTSDSASVSDMPENSVRGNASQKYIYIRNSSYATLADFTTGEANTQLVYELATPITYTLTPKQLSLLKGTNHISTNASTVKVTFRAGQLATLEDVAGAVEIADGHIETALTPILGDFADIETSPAASNHAVGEYLIYDSKLYKVIAAITAGETLTEGTNIGRTTVAAELASLGGSVDVAYSLTLTNNNLISQNSDVNDYYYRGIYVVPSASVAQTIANLPIGGGGKLLVEDILIPGAALGSFRVLQTYFENNMPNRFYRRYWSGAAWSAWYKFEGTAMS